MNSLSNKLKASGASGIFLLIEAILLLIVARAAIRVWKFEKIAALASARASGRSVRPSKPGDLQRCAWAIAASAKRSPFRALCFERGIAATWMLRRRGYDPTLYYGLKLRDGAEGLRGHVWVLQDGYGITGAGLAGQYQVMASFPKNREEAAQSMTVQLQPW